MVGSVQAERGVFRGGPVRVQRRERACASQSAPDPPDREFHERFQEAGIPDRESIRANDPLRLETAAALAFPDGSMTASGLRSEAAKGRLAIEKIAGRIYTTLEAVDAMRALCRTQPKPQQDIEAIGAAVRSTPAPRDLKAAQAAALVAAERRKMRTKNRPRPIET